MAGHLGQQLGNYRLNRLLGRGSFAEVYLGEHVFLGTPAAIKVLRTQLVEHNEMERFQQEARIIARLEHPHIVRLFDFDLQEGIPFLVMAYAPNGSLRQRHPKGIPVPLHMVLDYVKQVADALQYAHEQKLIHRDIKPENMLIGQRNEILLSDFGIALIAQSSYLNTQEIAGSPQYMAPEQLQGKPRPSSDQYSLGVVVYEWLCGSCPFEGSFTEVVSQHVLTPPPSLCEKIPTISTTIEQVVMTALAKDPKQRFASMRAFAAALEQACQIAPSRPVALSSDPDQLPPPAMPVEPSVDDGHETELMLDMPARARLILRKLDGFVKRWHPGVRQGVIIAVGSILFSYMSRFEPPLRLSGVSPFLSPLPIFPAIVIPVFFGAIFGPWIGFLTGVIGYLVEHYMYSSRFLWPTNLNLALIGCIAGIAMHITKGHYNTIRAIALADFIGAIAVTVGTACGAYGLVWVIHESLRDASILFTTTVLPDVTLSVILLPILLIAYQAIRKAYGTLLNSNQS